MLEIVLVAVAVWGWVSALRYKRNWKREERRANLLHIACKDAERALEQIAEMGDGEADYMEEDDIYARLGLDKKSLLG